MADKEVSDALCYSMRQRGARFLTEESIKSVEVEKKMIILYVEYLIRIVETRKQRACCPLK